MTLPTDDLVAHFDASTGVTITGSGVSQWNDQSGQDNHATQGTDANRPEFLTIGGKDSLVFDGANHYLSFPAIGGTSNDFCAFFVAQVQEYDTDAHEIPLNIYGTSTNLNFLVNTATGSSKIKVRNYDSGLRVGTSLIPYGVNSGASETTVYVGKESATGEVLTEVLFESGGVIGALNVGPSFHFDGIIRALVIYSAEQSAANITAIRDYLTTTYECVSRTEDRFILCEGDSLTKGNAAPNEGYDRQLALLYATQPKITNVGVGGQSLSTMTSNAVSISDVELSRNSEYTNQIAVLWGGTNDIVGGGSLGDLQTNMLSWVSGRQAAGAKVVVLTIIPRSDNSAAEDLVRLAFNEWILTGATGADAIANVNADSRLQDPTDGTYFKADEVHLIAAGHAIVADYVKAAIDSLEQVDYSLLGTFTDSIAISGEYDASLSINGEW